MKKVASVVAITFGLFFAPMIGAQANELLSTSPTAGQSLESAPSAVTISTAATLMSEGNEVTVTDPQGVRVDDGLLTIAGTDAVVGLRNFIRSGIYKVNYTLLSENDIPLTGSFTFNFAEPTIVATIAPEPSKTAIPSGNNAGTTIFVLGLLLAALVVTVALARYAKKLYSER